MTDLLSIFAELFHYAAFIMFLLYLFNRNKSNSQFDFLLFTFLLSSVYNLLSCIVTIINPNVIYIISRRASYTAEFVSITIFMVFRLIAAAVFFAMSLKYRMENYSSGLRLGVIIIGFLNDVIIQVIPIAAISMSDFNENAYFYSFHIIVFTVFYLLIMFKMPESKYGITQKIEHLPAEKALAYLQKQRTSGTMDEEAYQELRCRILDKL